MDKQSKKSDGTPVTARINRRLHRRLTRYAAGDSQRPRTSLNDAMEFLIARGLDAVGAPEAEAVEEPMLAA